MSYYKCNRCNYISKQKVDMKRHLDKLKKCIIINISDKSENELYEDSLIKYEIHNGLELNIEKKEKKEKKFNCDKCNKKFYNKSNLNRHVLTNKLCKKMENVTNIQNITNITNNTNNIINIHINSLKGFDEDWNTSKITNDMREKLLLSDKKFTNTLKNILQNDENLNVILKDSTTGIVYKMKNNQYEAMNMKDIFEVSMDKIYRHLRDFFEEIVDTNENIHTNIILDIDSKYNNYKKNVITKKDVNNCLLNIFDENKNKSIEKFIEVNEDKPLIEDNPIIENCELNY